MGGTEAGFRSPHPGNCLSQRRNIKGRRETADLWQPKWNENQTVLAKTIHTQVCTNIIEKNANPEWNQVVNLQIKVWLSFLLEKSKDTLVGTE